jgi:DNA-binding NarL/FixJ family response regulator
MDTRSMKILVADDHDFLRAGLRQLLSRPGWDVCAEAKTGTEAVALAERHKPEVVVMDVGMPELNGLEATRQIRKILPKTQIVILTMHFSDELVRDIVEAGARGYLLKTDADQELVKAVETVARHGSYFTSGAANTLAGPHQITNLADARKKNLTPRERQLVQLLAEGKSSQEASASLGISPKTAETHRSNLMRKLGLHSISQLTRWAIRNNIIQE